MTTLFTGSVPIAIGTQERGPFVVPGGIKQPGVPIEIKIALGAEQFPDGTTNVEILISTDGGTVYRSASMTVVMPAVFRGAPPHFWRMSFSLGSDDSPTHCKTRTIAPAGFTTTLVIEAV
jgi:hypothetical protein